MNEKEIQQIISCVLERYAGATGKTVVSQPKDLHLLRPALTHTS